MLQAMNTGHEGSLSTIHANKPREALMRLENLVGLAGVNIPTAALRTQIASAVDMIIQVQRMRDGVRRVTQISEVAGLEGEVIVTQDLFTFEYQGEHRDGSMRGAYRSTGVRPAFIERLAYYGLDSAYMTAVEPDRG
jgi:pilus assembly protein CpaF